MTLARLNKSKTLSVALLNHAAVLLVTISLRSGLPEPLLETRAFSSLENMIQKKRNQEEKT